jgi:hypothetical protein
MGGSGADLPEGAHDPNPKMPSELQLSEMHREGQCRSVFCYCEVGHDGPLAPVRCGKWRSGASTPGRCAFNRGRAHHQK